MSEGHVGASSHKPPPSPLTSDPTATRGHTLPPLPCLPPLRRHLKGSSPRGPRPDPGGTCLSSLIRQGLAGRALPRGSRGPRAPLGPPWPLWPRRPSPTLPPALGPLAQPWSLGALSEGPGPRPSWWQDGGQNP